MNWPESAFLEKTPAEEFDAACFCERRLTVIISVNSLITRTVMSAPPGGPPPPGAPPAKQGKLAMIQEKIEAQRAKLRAKFGDEKVGKGEKICLIICIVLFVWFLVTFVLPLVIPAIICVGIYYYIMNKKKVDQNAKAAAVVGQSVNVQQLAATAQATSTLMAVAAPPGGPQAGVASPWQQMTDPGSGKAYYYNKDTGATSWERPADMV